MNHDIAGEDRTPGIPTASAGAVITDAAGRVLVVKPTYKPGWNLVGGHVDAGETPRAACRREIREETGLDLAVGDLLVHARALENGLAVHEFFVFDGGLLSLSQEQAITCQEEELAEYRFVAPEAVTDLVPSARLPLWHAALSARTGRRPVTVDIDVNVDSDQGS